MNSREELEKKVVQLEYRLRIIERFLDRSGMLFHKNDESLMNADRIDIINDMKEEGFDGFMII